MPDSIYDLQRQATTELTARGAQFEIKEIELRGARIKTYKNAPPSLREVWLASTAYMDRDYLVYEDECWTYAEAHAQVASIANWLRHQGVKPGDRVAIAMRNYPQWMLIYWATVATGAVNVGINAWWVGPELVYGLNDSTPKVLFCDRERLETYRPHAHQIDDMTVVGVRLDEQCEDVIDYAEVLAVGGTLPEVAVDPDADACIFYTSGTTGRPKGAQLTHRGCVSNLMSMAFAGMMNARVMELKTGETPDPEAAPVGSALVTTPLFHVTANNCIAQGTTLSGGKMTLMHRWDPLRALQLIERETVTAMSGVPVMARELIEHPEFASHDTSSLLTLGGGGAQLQPDLVGKIDAAVEARPNTGFGMTETCGIITSVAGDFFVDKPDSAGPALPVYDVKCVDDDGNELPQGEVGELFVKGAHVIRGYLNRPDATAESITDGWLHTGDVARLDEDGYIYIVDRKKDMVIRGGENIYCAEVESAVHEHAAIAECTVFGVPDDRLGEEVGAAVVLKDGKRLDPQDLRAHCRERVAKHKVPRYIWIMPDKLPRNANGKFLKRELRESLTVADAG
ncbi:MAG: class I adenylate-forming enzyme family protein [Pseudomonadales bacterium]|jgi:long-chain acyl-CoA synthetase|nr:class I adenylate-forming enzyme family protein [Pseudomonadales bacterium]